MADQIPNLFGVEKDAERLYALYLGRLRQQRQHEQIVYACRQIRRYGTQGPGITHALFTFSPEIDALCDLGNHKSALRQVRQWERFARGEVTDLRKSEWTIEETVLFPDHYVPL